MKKLSPVKVLVCLVGVSCVFLLSVLIKVTSVATPSTVHQQVHNPEKRKTFIEIIKVTKQPPTSTVVHQNITIVTGNDGTTPPPTAVSVFPFMDEGKSWKDPFCDEFLSNRFSVQMTPCDHASSRVMCYGSPYDDKMGSCFLRRLAMDPVKFHSVMRTDRDSVQTSNALWLAREGGAANPCPQPVFDPMEKYMVGGDYVKRLAKTAILSVPKGTCQKWINGTTFMFMGFDTHIYFKYLSWFSLHNGIINFEEHSGRKPSLIIRIPETKGQFMHSEYEKKLFPETNITSLADFSSSHKDTNVCFEEVIVTPWAYSTNAFRCKMADSIFRLRSKCYNCNSRGLPGTRYSGFRRRALAACNIEEQYPDPVDTRTDNAPKKIVVEIRKPYMRHDNDRLHSFHRTLVNPKALLDGLQEGFPEASVQPMVAEELPLCEQIKMVHDADVLLGVHGAGLVHVWWLQDHALLFELVPVSQSANPSFKMLSALTGKRYYEYGRVKGGEMEVVVDSSDVVRELKKRY